MAIAAGEFGPEEVVLSAVPSPYGFGLWSAHFVPALLGCPTVLMERFEVERMLELLEGRRVTFLACVTTQMMMMLGSPSFEQRDLGALRTVFTGGEAVSAEAAARFEATPAPMSCSSTAPTRTGRSASPAIATPRSSGSAPRADRSPR